MAPTPAVPLGAPGLPVRILHRRRSACLVAVRRLVSGAYVWHHGRIPPLLLPPHLQDEPAVPVRPGSPRLQRHAERAPVVGGAPPGPPSPFGHAQGPALAGPQHAVVGPRGL